MMVEGGQAEGGETVHTKEMRTEINGGSATDPANFEVTFKHPGKLYVNKFAELSTYLISISIIYLLADVAAQTCTSKPGGRGRAAGRGGGGRGVREVRCYLARRGGDKYDAGRSGAASWTSCSPWWDTPSGSATSGGSPTSASETGEVRMMSSLTEHYLVPHQP